tara:strand:- start:461 stop:1627 length:1167 start_codon:yes stop_codon:yes gene_type:complete
MNSDDWKTSFENEEMRKEEEDKIWASLLKTYFNLERKGIDYKEKPTNYDLFVINCAQSNYILNKCLYEIFETIVGIFDTVYEYYNDLMEEVLDEKMKNLSISLYHNKEFEIVDYKSVFEHVRIIKLLFNEHVNKELPIRIFIQKNIEKIEFVVFSIIKFILKSYVMLDHIVYNNSSTITLFMGMFMNNELINTNTYLVQLLYKLKENIKSDKDEINSKIESQYGGTSPPIVANISDFITMTEDSIIASHCFLTGSWIDEKTFEYDSFERRNEQSIPLYILGKMFMTHIEDNNIVDEDIFKPYFLEKENVSELKLKFKKGERHEKGFSIFSLEYLKPQSAQFWFDLLNIRINGKYLFFIEEKRYNDQNDLVTFKLSIRSKNLLNYFNSY